VRGIAIFIMIFANSTPHFLKEDLPNSLRIFCSLAAPLFIFLSGFNANSRGDISVKIKRSFYMFLSAITVDVLLWHIFPIVNFDVLYLISAGLLVNTILHKVSPYVVIFISLFGFFIYSLTFTNFSYNFSLPDFNWHDYTNSKGGIHLPLILKRIAIDGWFPIFPWIFYATLGMSMYSLYKNWTIQIKRKIYPVISLLFLLTFTTVLSIKFESPREGYVEIFYPVTPFFIVLSLCWIFLALTFVEVLQDKFKNRIFVGRAMIYLGKNSLLIYFLHIILIHCLNIAEIQLNVYELFIYTALAAAFIILILIALNLIFKVRKVNEIPKVISFIFGIKPKSLDFMETSKAK
jgi:surface polysaccharide O-acyltransferase-like enzyme